MFKVDMHVHTKEVSRCGRVSAERIVREYKKAGYDGIVICDHFDKGTFDRLKGIKWKSKVKNYLQGYYKAKEAGGKAGLEVYLGMELRCPGNGNDYLIYGADEDFIVKNEKLYMKSLEEIKKITDENNLVMIQAHPYRVMCTPAPAHLVHGVEVFNGHFNHNSQNHLAQELFDKNGGIATSGSDAHCLCDVGNGGIVFKEKPENIADALRGGRYSLIKSNFQWADILFLQNATGQGIKQVLAFKEVDALAEVSDGVLTVKDISGNEIEKTNGIYVINRCQIVIGADNLKNASGTEPVILFTDEICDEIKDKISEEVLLVVAPKSDDTAPYKEGGTMYMGFDMAGDTNMFIAEIMGPSIRLEKIEL